MVKRILGAAAAALLVACGTEPVEEERRIVVRNGYDSIPVRITVQPRIVAGNDDTAEALWHGYLGPGKSTPSLAYRGDGKFSFMAKISELPGSGMKVEFVRVLDAPDPGKVRIVEIRDDGLWVDGENRPFTADSTARSPKSSRSSARPCRPSAP